MRASFNESAERVARVGRLLAAAGFGAAFDLEPLPGGGNSRAFHIRLASAALSLFVKEYFHHADDKHDRLGTEFAFASFAWNQGLRTLAQPYALERNCRCALYAFLEGRKLLPHEITREVVGQCLQFFQALNACKMSAQAAALPAGAEACFCLQDHWQCLYKRVRRLEAIVPQSGVNVDEQAYEFIHTKLAPACVDLLAQMHQTSQKLGLSPEAHLAERDRCLSPSDFGFHNALLCKDGTLYFLDFEYAGWDDPAKTVCDFFCQPGCPVPMEFYEEFAAALAADTSDPPLHRRRFDLLMPLYQLKWCCIMLNDFLPSGGSRRRFARYDLDETSRKTEQLHKARQALQRCQQGRCGQAA